jgi:uncharacterized protein (TIGR02452 family)
MENIKTFTEQHIEKCKQLNIDNPDKKYRFDPFFKYQKRFENTKIEVINVDCLDCALDNTCCLLLNMGNELNPGGNYLTIGSQEEDLFRRTDLCIHLDPSLYPIKKACVIVSENVRVFSKGLRQKYEVLENVKYVHVVTCASIHNKNNGNYLDSFDLRLMTEKIKTIFQVAYMLNYKTLILSAFGCGARNCPSLTVSRLFKNVIKEYDGCVEKVIFAIFNDNEPKSNFEVFKEQFS